MLNLKKKSHNKIRLNYSWLLTSAKRQRWFGRIFINLFLIFDIKIRSYHRYFPQEVTFSSLPLPLFLFLNKLSLPYYFLIPLLLFLSQYLSPLSFSLSPLPSPQSFSFLWISSPTTSPFQFSFSFRSSLPSVFLFPPTNYPFCLIFLPVFSVSPSSFLHSPY
jgi:hypothetical protein